jgi:signal transduction histidine kinase
VLPTLVVSAREEALHVVARAPRRRPRLRAARPEGAASTRTGLGLRETRERLRLSGEKLRMISSAKCGTTAEISLPERAESTAPAAA